MDDDQNEFTLEKAQAIFDRVTRSDGAGVHSWSERLQQVQNELSGYTFDNVPIGTGGHPELSSVKVIATAARMNVSNHPLMTFELLRSLGPRIIDTEFMLTSAEIEMIGAESEEGVPTKAQALLEGLQRNPDDDEYGDDDVYYLDFFFEEASVVERLKRVVTALNQMRGSKADVESVRGDEKRFGYSLQHLQAHRYTNEEIEKLFEETSFGHQVPKDLELSMKKRFLVSLPQKLLAAEENLKQVMFKKARSESIFLLGKEEPLLQPENRDRISAWLKNGQSTLRSVRKFVEDEKKAIDTFVDAPDGSIGEFGSFSHPVDSHPSGVKRLLQMRIPPYPNELRKVLFTKRPRALEMRAPMDAAKLIAECQSYFKSKLELVESAEHFVKEMCDETTIACLQEITEQQGVANIASEDNIPAKRIMVIGCCLTNAGVSLPVTQREERADAVRNVGGGLGSVAEISRCILGRNETPIAVKDMNLGDDDDVHHKIYEIGCCVAGTYREIDPSNASTMREAWIPSLASSKDEFVFFQYLPPGDSFPGSLPFEKLNEHKTFSHILMVLPEWDSQSSWKGYKDVSEITPYLLVDLREDETSIQVPELAASMSYIGVSPIIATSPPENGSRTFARLAVLYSSFLGGASAEIVQNFEEIARRVKFKRFKESLGVIHEALSLVMKTDKPNQGDLEGKPMLLYFASDGFRREFKLAEAADQYWEEIREMLKEKEHVEKWRAFNLVYDLQSRFDVSVASEQTLEYIPRVLADYFLTDLQFEEVEKSNCRALCNHLEKISKHNAAPRYVFIRVHGKIDAASIQELVSCASPAVKLIFEYRVEIIIAFRDCSFGRAKIRSIDKSERFETDEDLSLERADFVTYDDHSSVGELVTTTYEHFAKHPEDFETFIQDDWSELLCDTTSEATGADGDSWMTKVYTWIVNHHQNSLVDGLSKTALLLVTWNAQFVTMRLRSRLRDCCEQIEEINARERGGVERLKKLADDPSEGLRNQTEGTASVGRLIILMEADFLPRDILSYVVAHCREHGDKIILMAKLPFLALTKLQDDSTDAASTSFAVVQQRLTVVDVLSIQGEWLKGNVPVMNQAKHVLATLLILFGPVVERAEVSATLVETIASDINSLQSDEDRDVLQVIQSARGMDGERGSSFSRELLKAIIKTNSETIKGTAGESLGVILARYVSLCIRNSDPSRLGRLLSFPEFCCRPRNAFFTQIHLVQAFTNYLRQFASQEDIPPFPNILSSFENLQNIRQPELGELLHATYAVVSSSSGSKRLPAPQYERPMKPNALMEESNIIETTAMMGGPLDTNMMHERWPVAVTISSQLLGHLLVWGKWTTSLVLVLDVHLIASLPIKQEGCGGIHPLLLEYLSILRLPAFANGRGASLGATTRQRVSSLGWVLIRSKLFQGIEDVVFNDIIARLVEADVRFDFDFHEHPDLADRIASELLCRDEPADLLTTRQQNIRAYLLTCSSAYQVQTERRSMINSKRGNVYIQLLAQMHPGASELHPFHLKQEDMAALKQWRTSPLDVNPQLEVLCRSITPAAAAAVFVHCPDVITKPEVLRTGLRCILLPCCAALNDEEKLDQAVVQFLRAVIAFNPTVALRVLDELGSAVGNRMDLGKRNLSDLGRTNGPFWSSAIDALRDGKIDPLLNRLLEENLSNGPFIADSPKLMELYLDWLDEHPMNSVTEDCRQHLRILPQTNSQETAFRWLMDRKRSDDPQNAELMNPRQKILLWFLWCACPQLYLAVEPELEQEWKDFQKVCEFSSRLQLAVKRARSPTLLARFMCMPHTLPLGALKTMIAKAKCLCTGYVVEEELLRFAQEENETFPPYVFRTHHRPLPRECIESLLKQAERELPANIEWTIRTICPQITEGVSVETLVHNFSLLCQGIKNLKLLQWKNTTSVVSHIGCALLAWFRAAGFTKMHLEELASRTNCLPDLKTSLDRIEYANKKTLLNHVVLCPLPVFVDVRFVETRSKMYCFGASASSVFSTQRWITQQWITILAGTYGFPQQVPRFYASLEESATTCLRELVEELSKAFTSKISELYSNAYPSPSGDPSSNKSEWTLDTTQLIDYLIVFVGFLDVLPHKLLEDVFRILACHLKTQEHGDEQACLISDSLFALIGLNPLNRGREMNALVEQFTAIKLKLSSTMVDECTWLLVNLYNRKGGGADSKMMMYINVDQLPRGGERFPFKRAVNDLATRRGIVENVSTFLEQSYIAPPSVVAASTFGSLVSTLVPISVATEEKISPSSSLRPTVVAVVPKKKETTPDQYRRQSGLDHTDKVLNETELASNFSQKHLIKDIFKPLKRVPELGAIEFVEPVPLSNSGAFRTFASKGAALGQPGVVVADTLLAVDTKDRHAILRIVPGKHTALVKPDDDVPRTRPVVRHVSLSKLSPQRPFSGKSQSVDHIFENHEQAWKHLANLQEGSLVRCREFCLRKLADGGWALMLGRDLRSPFYLWNILDTSNLINLDMAPQVVEMLSCIVQMSLAKAFRLTETPPLLRALNCLRDISELTVQENEYKAYLAFEFCFCDAIDGFIRDLKNFSERSGVVARVPDMFLNRLKGAQEKLKISLLVGDAHDEDPELSHLMRLLTSITISSSSIPRSTLAETIQLVLDSHCRDFNDGDSIEEEDDDDLIVNTRRNLIALGAEILGENFARGGLKLIDEVSRVIPFMGQIGEFREFQDESMEGDDKEEEGSNGFYDGDDSLPFGSTAMEADAAAQVNASRTTIRRVLPFTASSSNASMKGRYLDDSLDRERTDEANSLLPAREGFGRPLRSRVCVLSAQDNFNVPLYFCELDPTKLKLGYSDSQGLLLGFLIPKNLLQSEMTELEKGLAKRKELTPAKRKECILAYRQQLLDWLVILFRAPIAHKVRAFFLDKLDCGPTPFAAPDHLVLDKILEECQVSITRAGGQSNNQQPVEKEPLETPMKQRNRSMMLVREEDMSSDGEHQSNTKHKESSSSLNLRIVTRCVAQLFPSGFGFTNALIKAIVLQPRVAMYCERKNNIYGIHVVQVGTNVELESLRLQFKEVSLVFEAMVQGEDDASMYLKIIDSFTDQTSIVYVCGLVTISDRLLKWLAEYTREYPWRFVFLEGTDTTWNFAENRDRCILLHAPEPATRRVKCALDLELHHVRRARPSHVVEYLEKRGLEELTREVDWNEFTRKAEVDGGVFAFKPASMANIELINKDFDETVRKELMENDNVVLLTSPPGAGKSYLAETLQHSAAGEGFICVKIDGSDDQLVFRTLQSILDNRVPSSVLKCFLVVDEYHMLGKAHKRQLFAWLRRNRLRVRCLLIANRLDAADENLMAELDEKRTSGSPSSFILRTRLNKDKLQTVMTSDMRKHTERILRWFHCARSLFGGEAVSLRGIAGLEKLFDEKHFPREQLCSALLDKVPTISWTTASDFVSCFECCSQMEGFKSDTKGALEVLRTRGPPGPITVLFQTAILTEQQDGVVDFPDFLVFTLERAYDYPPGIRFAAWVAYVIGKLSDKSNVSLLRPVSDLYVNLLVDQVGFPFQLPDKTTPWEMFLKGRAFSWSGNMTSLDALTDALKRGQSVDWGEVRRRVWQHSDVEDVDKFVTLLSNCRSPAKALHALSERNLCQLLRKGGEAATLARYVVQEKVFLPEEEDATKWGFLSPFPTAVWVLAMTDPVRAYKNAIANKNSKREAEVTEETNTDEFCKSLLQLVEDPDTLINCLIWASGNAHSLTNCQRSKETSVFFHQLLEELTLTMLEDDEDQEKIKQKIAPLWTGLFSRLFVAQATDLSVVRAVLEAVEDEVSGWDELEQTLWRIVHCKASSADIGWIWNDYKQLLLDDHDDDDASEPELHPLFAGALLSANETVSILPMEIQQCILANGYSIPASVSNIQRAMALLANAIEVEAEAALFTEEDDVWESQTKWEGWTNTALARAIASDVKERRGR